MAVVKKRMRVELLIWESVKSPRTQTANSHRAKKTLFSSVQGGYIKGQMSHFVKDSRYQLGLGNNNKSLVVRF